MVTDKDLIRGHIVWHLRRAAECLSLSVNDNSWKAVGENATYWIKQAQDIGAIDERAAEWVAVTGSPAALRVLADAIERDGMLSNAVERDRMKGGKA
jgi:hypothetical protein